MSEKIRFTCEVVEVRVMKADSTVRVTLDLPETAIPQMALLAECKRHGWALKAVMTPDATTELTETEAY